MRPIAVHVVLLASAAVAVPQQIPVWQDMQRDIEAKLDQQLERLSNFSALDARFRASTQRSVARVGPDRAEPSPASPLAVNGMPAAISDFVRFYSGPGRGFYENGTQRLKLTDVMIVTGGPTNGQSLQHTPGIPVLRPGWTRPG